MRKRILPVVGLLFTLMISACSLLREPEAASGPIEAVPLEIETPANMPEPTAVPPAPTASPTEAPDEAATIVPAEPIVEPTQTPAEGAVADQPAETETAGGLLIFSIDPEASQVRFELDEDLRGQRQTVVGVTNQVAGEIAVDFSDLSTVQVGVIQINARTLATDNNFRNRALNNQILDTGTYEFITFTPKAVTGLPDNVSVGDEVTFTVDGTLTIRDISHEVSFAVTATAVSETQLTGTASTTVNRTDYDLQIPSVPNVANVEEEVELYIDFTANAS